ncbi:putative polygalacturonase [Senna tora]|uniref:endo-polygalacturonase n=1 Tax=Senna tora TaxID=362788 RepID=A0A834W9N2_9FABA|nr:putative polygalacturonase [Senna tora]
MKNLRSASSSSSSSPFIIIMIISILHLLLLSLHLKYTEAFESVIRLPHSGSDSTIRFFSKRVLSLGHYGAKGDGLHNDTQAFQDVWNIACSISGRITIQFPPGKSFLIHPIDIGGPCRSKITLRILGTIVAPKDPSVWDTLNPRKWIYFHGVKYLTINGGGKINGMGQEWWKRSCKINSTNPCHPAPTAITFHKCKNLKISDLMILNSQQIHMQFTSCMRIFASHLKVLAPASSPNTDGIHISRTKGIVVRESLIRTGDDCISIVRNSSRVRIRNISCGPGHGISIGSLGKSGSWEKVQDIMVNGAYLYNTDNGVRIKTWQGGGGFVSDITFQNILMDRVSHPIIIDQYYCDSRRPCHNQGMQTSALKVENVSFINIRGTSRKEEAIRFACSDEFPCEGLFLEDIFLIPYFGGKTRSYCWEAYGSTQGLVHPPACFPETNSFIRQKVWTELDSAINVVSLNKAAL